MILVISTKVIKLVLIFRCYCQFLIIEMYTISYQFIYDIRNAACFGMKSYLLDCRFCSVKDTADLQILAEYK